MRRNCEIRDKFKHFMVLNILLGKKRSQKLKNTSETFYEIMSDFKTDSKKDKKQEQHD